MEKFPCHSDCKYPGWLGLTEWCRHPDHLEPIEPGRRLAIKEAGGKCGSWIDWEAKVMEGEEPPWPMPASLRQLIAVIAVCVPTEYEINEKSVKK